MKMQLLVKFTTVLLCIWKVNSQFCMKDDDIKCDIGVSNETSKSSDKWKETLEMINFAVSNYKECNVSQCSCHYNLIKKDLKAFGSSITKVLIDSSKTHGTLYQIIDHKLYREDNCLFPSRCSGIEYFLLKIIEDLPDMEFVINTRDWPQVHKRFNEKRVVFSFSKTNDYADITFPAWTFWEGGPAISLYPSGLGRWDLHRKRISKEASKFPWKRKKNQAFFRGSRTSAERDPLILLSRTEPQLVDAQYTKNQAWKSDADTLYSPPAREVLLEDHCAFKYLFNYRGVAASFRFKHLFLCDSLVFHVGNSWIEFFYPKMKPWVHYIPISSDATVEDIRKMLRFAQENDEVAQEIAERGTKFIKNHLRMKDIFCYWRKLLKSYAKLLKYDITKRENTIFIGG